MSDMNRSIYTRDGALDIRAVEAHAHQMRAEAMRAFFSSLVRGLTFRARATSRA